MHCKQVQKQSDKWLSEKLEKSQEAAFQAHVAQCNGCRKEIESRKKLDRLLKAVEFSIVPSSEFEARLWEKIALHHEESPLFRLFQDLKWILPIPNLAQVVTVVMIAFFMGGAGGVVSAMNTLTPEHLQADQVSIQYLSGFQGFKGLPFSSVSAAYLKTTQERISS